MGAKKENKSKKVGVFLDLSRGEETVVDCKADERFRGTEFFGADVVFKLKSVTGSALNRLIKKRTHTEKGEPVLDVMGLLKDQLLEGITGCSLFTMGKSRASEKPFKPGNKKSVSDFVDNCEKEVLALSAIITASPLEQVRVDETKNS